MPNQSNPQNRKLAVLFVDDEEELQELIVDLSYGLGVDVTTASSGDEALQLWGTGKFDLVFSDLTMPKMNGFQVLSAIRAIKPDVPFIFWSGFWNNDDIQTAKKFSRTQCIDKPATIETLREALTAVRGMINEG